MSSQTTILLALCAVFLAGWVFSTWRSRVYFRISNERMSENISIAAECRVYKKHCNDLADELEKREVHVKRRNEFIENFLLVYVSETSNAVTRVGPMVDNPEVFGLSVRTPHGALYFAYPKEMDEKFKTFPLVENDWGWTNFSTIAVHSNQRQVYADWLMTAEIKLKNREQAQTQHSFEGHHS